HADHSWPLPRCRPRWKTGSPRSRPVCGGSGGPAGGAISPPSWCSVASSLSYRAPYWRCRGRPRACFLWGGSGWWAFWCGGVQVGRGRAGPSPKHPAGVIEGQFPGLGARLLSVTSRDTELVNGTPHLLLALTRDTARRFRVLDVEAAAPTRPVVRHAAVVGLL